MKKSIKTIAITLLAAGMLAGCSSGGSADWSSDDKEAMKEILYGVELPYVSGVSDLEVYPSVSDGKISIFGDKVSTDTLFEYATKYADPEAGWQLISYELAEDQSSTTREGEEIPKIIEYVFEKGVLSEGEERFVRVTFGSYVAGEDYSAIPALDGDFCLWAYDPYYYSWPDFIYEKISELLGTKIVVPEPEFESTRYYFDSDYFETDCYLAPGITPDAAIASYSKTLAADFDVYGYDDGLEAYVATAKDELFGVCYGYLASTGEFFVALTDPLYTKSFPSDMWENYVGAMFASYVVAPGIESGELLPECYSYYYVPSEYFFEVLIHFGTLEEGDDPVAAYTASLEDAGFFYLGEVADDSSDVSYRDGEDAAPWYHAMSPDFGYDVYYQFDDGILYVQPYTTSGYYDFGESFPSEAILNFLYACGEEAEIELPEYVINDEEGYFDAQGEYDYFGMYNGGLYLTVYANNSTTDELESYVSELVKDYNWEVVASGGSEYPYYYILQSPDSGTFLAIDEYISSGYVQLDFFFAPQLEEEFPAEKIAASLAYYGITDTLPAYSGELPVEGGDPILVEAIGFYWNDDDDLQLTIGVDEGSEADCVDAYVADLIAAGYVEGGVDDYGDMHYISPNGQLDVCPWDGSVYGYDGFVYVDVVPLVA